MNPGPHPSGQVLMGKIDLPELGKACRSKGQDIIPARSKPIQAASNSLAESAVIIPFHGTWSQESGCDCGSFQPGNWTSDGGGLSS